MWLLNETFEGHDGLYFMPRMVCHTAWHNVWPYASAYLSAVCVSEKWHVCEVSPLAHGQHRNQRLEFINTGILRHLEAIEGLLQGWAGGASVCLNECLCVRGDADARGGSWHSLTKKWGWSICNFSRKLYLIHYGEAEACLSGIRLLTEEMPN